MTQTAQGITGKKLVPPVIYRKWKNRDLYLKISPGQVVKVHTGDYVSIVIAYDNVSRYQAVSPSFTEPSSFDAFEKAYGEAMFRFNKTRQLI